MNSLSLRKKLSSRSLFNVFSAAIPVVRSLLIVREIFTCLQETTPVHDPQPMHRWMNVKIVFHGMHRKDQQTQMIFEVKYCAFILKPMERTLFLKEISLQKERRKRVPRFIRWAHEIHIAYP